MTTILLVDDHPVVREGFRGMLEAEPDFTVIGEASSALEAVAAAQTLQPDVILMDLRMPGQDGVWATERILSAQPSTRILIVTTYESDSDIVRAVETGAAGYILKNASRHQLAEAVRQTAIGRTVLAPSVAERLIRSTHQRAAIPNLSAREIEILTHVAKGATNADIGRALFISEATVKTHLLRTFNKLDVGDRTAAVTTAQTLGLLPHSG
ncbi:LuxR family transcriptional regulator [Mycobacteroides immunogenum]|uniref:LuxR family transcriptional regulator n=1 Tax=Mycobacteroides immunogenum TaxID=83262 RepID=A0A179VAG6_9MYCO|nr:response regulator transcription factor [Mycobacteroides immunogenum]OAT67955.1 LuxR family transcriptional regulator [Mycobacteroides immunogenum]